MSNLIFPQKLKKTTIEADNIQSVFYYHFSKKIRLAGNSHEMSSHISLKQNEADRSLNVFIVNSESKTWHIM